MGRHGPAIVALTYLISAPSIDVRARSSGQGRPTDSNELPIVVRPAMLAGHVALLAGHSVRVPNARVVGVFDPHVFLIESQTLLRPLVGFRDRVLVFVEGGTLRVSPETLVASSVTVSGVARTLLGMQVSREVPWPAALTRDAVERLEIRAAVLATSVRTAEGVDLTVRSPAASTTVSSPSPEP